MYYLTDNVANSSFSCASNDVNYLLTRRAIRVFSFRFISLHFMVIIMDVIKKYIFLLNA